MVSGEQTPADIEAWLRRPSARAFPPALEARYDALCGEPHRRRLARALTAIGILMILAACLDLETSRAVFVSALPWRAASAALCLAGALGMTRLRRPWQMALLYGPAVLSMTLVIEYVGMLAPGAAHDRYVMAAIVIFGVTLVSTPPPLSAARVVCAAVAWMYPLLLWLNSGTRAEVEGAVFIALTTAAIGLLLVRRNEIARRQSFLETTRYELAALELTRMNAELLHACSTDGLTGLANRRSFESEAARIWSNRYKDSIGVVFTDVDHFKRYNDSAGHVAGDACLRTVADACSGALRNDDCRFARYGGEEFAALVPGISRTELEWLGERLRAAVADLAMDHPGLSAGCVTISVGLAWRAEHTDEESVETLLRQADRALYVSKNAGRNRVSWGEEVSEPPVDAGGAEPGLVTA